MRIYLAAFVFLAGACGDDPAASDAGPIDARIPGGTLSLSWTLTDGVNALDCEDVAGVTVQITATPVDGLSGSAVSFTCTSGTGTSPDLEPGTYTVRIDLRASANRSLLAAPIMVSDVVLTQNQDTALAPVEFTVIPSGSFSFTINTTATGTNCGNGADDADIAEIQFELADADGTCVVATFEVASGGVQYTTACPTPVIYPGGCIETNQIVSVATTPSGTQSLTMTASKPGPTPCWRRVSQFSIPGNNLSADLMSQRLALDNTPQCDPNAPDAGP